MSRQSAASTCRLEAASVGAQASRWGPGQVALEFGLGLGLGYGSATAFERLVTSGQYASWLTPAELEQELEADGVPAADLTSAADLAAVGGEASADTGLAALFQLFEDLGPEAFGLAA